MPDELQRMFTSLGADADRTPLMAAPALRARTNRRVAVRTGLAGLALVVAVGGTALGSRWLLTGPDDPIVAPPATSATPSPSSPTRAIPGSVPMSAFLTSEDLNDDTGLTTPSEDRPAVPSFCGAGFPSADAIGVRRTLRAQYRGPAAARTDVPDGVVRQTVAVFRGQGAEQFLAEVRQAVKDCPTETNDLDGMPTTYRLIDPVDAGDESVRVEERSTGAAAPGSAEKVTFTQQISIVRSGDAVTVLWTGGYENDSAKDATVVALTRAAVRHLAAWR